MFFCYCVDHFNKTAAFQQQTCQWKCKINIETQPDNSLLIKWCLWPCQKRWKKASSFSLHSTQIIGFVCPHDQKYWFSCDQSDEISQKRKKEYRNVSCRHLATEIDRQLFCPLLLLLIFSLLHLWFSASQKMCVNAKSCRIKQQHAQRKRPLPIS